MHSPATATATAPAARCELLRAHMGSGMRDSDATSYLVPEAVEQRYAVEAFLHYIYKVSDR